MNVPSHGRLGGSRWVLSGVAALCLAMGSQLARADEIDEALKATPDVALERIDAWLAELGNGEADLPRLARLLRARAALQRLLGRPAAAVADHEALAARGVATPQDTLAHAQALEEAGRIEAQRPQGGSVGAYFEDALAVLAPLLRAPVQGETALRALDLEATLLEALGRGEAALRSRARVALAELPESWRGYWSDAQARLHYGLAQYEQAAEAFLQSGNEAAAAAAFDAAGLGERSVPIYATLLAQRPTDAALAAQALQGARYGKVTRALAQALAAIEVPAGEDGLELLLLHATLREESGDPIGALAGFEQAAERVPLDARAWKGIARTVPRSGAEAELATRRAIQAWEKALLLDPEDPEAIEGLSWYAGADYQRLWRLGPEHPLAQRCLRLQEALVAASRGEDGIILGNLANTLRVLGRSAEAVATYERARAANPYDPDVTSDMGLALSAAGEPEQALAAFLEAVALDPSNLSARQNAARLLWRGGMDLEAAEQLVAAARSARAVGRPWGVYLHLLDRAWRTHRSPEKR